MAANARDDYRGSGQIRLATTSRPWKPCIPSTMQLPWLAPGEPLPDAASAWGESDPVPGLLAAGGGLDVDSLLQAYGNGIFPWFSEGQPILWWSPDPRMVLRDGAASGCTDRCARRWSASAPRRAARSASITRFEAVIDACSQAPRAGQIGHLDPAGDDATPTRRCTAPAMRTASRPGSTASWPAACTASAIGRAVFGESMFALRPGRLQDRAGGAGRLLPAARHRA